MQNFNYHSHTYRCGHADLDVSDEDYVKEYIKMGFKKIAFTDHCPEKNIIDDRPNVRMAYSQRNEYLKSIEGLKQKYANKIEIQSGYEVEFLPGEEENIKELKNEVDKIIIGQHFVYNDDNELVHFFGNENAFSEKELLRYAEYIVKAMELEIPDIIAHPDLYMKVKDSFGDTEAKIAHLICQSAEKYNIPLEINLNHIFNEIYYENDNNINVLPLKEQKEKLKDVAYPNREFWKIASDYNIKVLYGIDVHRGGQILLFKELVELANEIIGEDIISKLQFIQN